jgi:hypothetical protein
MGQGTIAGLTRIEHEHIRVARRRPELDHHQSWIRDQPCPESLRHDWKHLGHTNADGNRRPVRHDDSNLVSA